MKNVRKTNLKLFQNFLYFLFILKIIVSENFKQLDDYKKNLNISSDYIFTLENENSKIYLENLLNIIDYNPIQKLDEIVNTENNTNYNEILSFFNELNHFHSDFLNEKNFLNILGEEQTFKNDKKQGMLVDNFGPILYLGNFKPYKNNLNSINTNLNNRTVSNLQTSEDDDDLFSSVIKFLKGNIADNILNLTITETCKNNFKEAYIDYKTKFFYYKIVVDSTKNKNDVGSFQDCILNNYKNKAEDYGDKLEYVVVTINSNKNSETQSNENKDYFENEFFIFGLCTIKGCENEDHKKILFQVNENLELFPHLNETEITLFTIGKEVFDFEIVYLFNLIPIFIFLTQILFISFPSIPSYLISCFFIRNKKKSTFSNEKDFFHDKNHDKDYDSKLCVDDDIIKTISNSKSYDLKNEKKEVMKINNKKIKEDSKINSNESLKQNCELDKKKDNEKKIEKIFSFLRNIQDLFLINFTKENIKPTYDFSSIGYILGLRGIAMIFMIVGNVFFILNESPLKIFSNDSNFLLRWNPIITIGIRLSPRILLACSGYCLSFKILNYFDGKMNFINEGVSGDQFFDEQNFMACEEEFNETSVYKKNKNSDSEKNSSTTYALPIKYLFSFLMRQFHKYLLYIFMIFFFKFCMYTLFPMISQIGPMWVYFKKNIIDTFGIIDLIFQIFLIDGFDFNNYKEKNFVYLFWIMSLEIKFFILTSFLLYFAYRRNNRLDLVIFAFIPLSIIAKILLFFLLNKNNNDFYPTIYYRSNFYYYISINPIFNYSIYLIGVIFGAMNFIHQKSLSYEDLKTTGKSYLILPFKIYNSFKTLKNSRTKTHGFLLILLFIIGTILATSQYILNKVLKIYNNDDIYYIYLKNTILNCFYMIDIEIFIIVLFFFCSGLSKSENNFIYNALKSNQWTFKNKIYFGFLLMMNILICFIFYQSESRIKIEFFNVVFISIVCYMNLIINSSILYILFDAPLKKLNKYILKLK